VIVALDEMLLDRASIERSAAGVMVLDRFDGAIAATGVAGGEGVLAGGVGAAGVPTVPEAQGVPLDTAPSDHVPHSGTPQKPDAGQGEPYIHEATFELLNPLLHVAP
jgi:hypothetical protein